jgi:hypothetical protein
MTGTGEMRRVRLIETTVLVLLGVLLAAATIYDVVLQTRVNHRLVADLRTWRAYTGHPYHNLAVDRQLFGTNSIRELVCGNTSAGPPGARTQLCLVISGTVADGRRSVRGGWYVPAYRQDVRDNRYGCFGEEAQGRCPAPQPSAGSG